MMEIGLFIFSFKILDFKTVLILSDSASNWKKSHCLHIYQQLRNPKSDSFNGSWSLMASSFSYRENHIRKG